MPNIVTKGFSTPTILDLHDSMCNFMDRYHDMYKNCLLMYTCNEVCEIKEHKFKKGTQKY